jgi:hypothetical protein
VVGWGRDRVPRGVTCRGQTFPLPDAGADAKAGVPDLPQGPIATCQDCSKVDPAKRTCPAGAMSVCDGRSIVQCVCGVPTYIVDVCAAACVQGTTGCHDEAFCAMSATRDKACPRAGYGNYCDGTTVVGCTEESTAPRSCIHRCSAGNTRGATHGSRSLGGPRADDGSSAANRGPVFVQARLACWRGSCHVGAP